MCPVSAAESCLALPLLQLSPPPRAIVCSSRTLDSWIHCTALDDPHVILGAPYMEHVERMLRKGHRLLGPTPPPGAPSHRVSGEYLLLLGLARLLATRFSCMVKAS